jgi:hypothetical protein
MHLTNLTLGLETSIESIESHNIREPGHFPKGLVSDALQSFMVGSLMAFLKAF